VPDLSKLGQEIPSHNEGKTMNQSSVQPTEEVDELRKLIKEALGPGVFGLSPQVTNLDPDVRQLCEKKGYGYVMQAAEQLWAERLKFGGAPGGGQHTVAACYAVRKDWCDRAKAALEGNPPFQSIGQSDRRSLEFLDRMDRIFRMKKNFKGTPGEITQQLSRAISKKFPRARARPGAHVRGRMNQTEKAYSEVLNGRMGEGGDVKGWVFEPVRRRLADNTYYEPDFEVLMTDGTLEYHEVKACRANGQVLVEDDAQVKIKVAAEMYPWFTWRRCALWRRKMFPDQWKIETYNTVE
jgi:hypothetical protein